MQIENLHCVKYWKRSKATINVDINDPFLEAYPKAQANLQGSFSKLLAVVENYPDLKTTQAFRDFQTQIEGTENRINVARQDYNKSIEGYNLKVSVFQGIYFRNVRFQKNHSIADAGSEKLRDQL
jgi:LemA protein